MIISKCLAIFGFGTCFMLFPLTEDMTNILKTINDNARCKKNRPKITNRFPKFVQFHSELIQLSAFLLQISIKNLNVDTKLIFLEFPFFLIRLFYDYSELLKMPLLILLTWSIAGISTQMLLLTLKMVVYFELYYIELTFSTFEN